MRILVTGASGFIGSAVCDALLARGDEVVGLSRDPEQARPTNPAATWHAWNPTSEPPPDESLDQVDGVINLLGENINQRLTDQAKRRIMDSRVVSTRNLLHAIEARDERPHVFVGQSAIGYYGDRGAEVLDEESDSADEGFDAEVMVAWERTQRDAERLGMRLALVRTGLVLSAEAGLLKELLLPFKLGVGGPLAGGKQFMSWISLDDAVGVLMFALDNDRVSGPINGTAPNPVINKEFSKELGRALNRPSFVPAPKLAVAVLRGRELAEIVTGSARVLPRRTLELGYDFRHPELPDALEAALR